MIRLFLVGALLAQLSLSQNCIFTAINMDFTLDLSSLAGQTLEAKDGEYWVMSLHIYYIL